MLRYVIPFALLVSLAFAPGRTSACSCAPVTLPEEVEGSHEIYTGFVVSIEPTTQIGGHAALLVALRPHWIWRGSPVDGVFRVITGVSTWDCGFPFEFDTEYLVFGHEDDTISPHSSASICGRTHAIQPGDADIDALGPPVVTPVRAGTWGAIKATYR